VIIATSPRPAFKPWPHPLLVRRTNARAIFIFMWGKVLRMRFSILLVAALPIMACSEATEPLHPTTTPERVSLTKISPAGIELLVEVAVDNPNPIDLEARSVSAKVVIDGKHDLDTVEIPHEIELPSDQRTHLAVPMQMNWKDATVVTVLVALNRTVPYDVDGSVSLGGDLVHVSVPFHMSDVMTQEQLLKAVTNPPPPGP
jgi:LEA14-like dessication related protein